MDDLDTKDIYLRKDNEIIGLHAVGVKGPYTYTIFNFDGTEITMTDDFNAYETWGNEYDETYDMLGRGSFRVFDNIEVAAQKFEADGWVRFERILK